MSPGLGLGLLRVCIGMQSIRACLCMGMLASGVCALSACIKRGADRRRLDSCSCCALHKHAQSQMRRRSKVAVCIAPDASWLPIQSHYCDTISVNAQWKRPLGSFIAPNWWRMQVRTAVKGTKTEAEAGDMLILIHPGISEVAPWSVTKRNNWVKSENTNSALK